MINVWKQKENKINKIIIKGISDIQSAYKNKTFLDLIGLQNQMFKDIMREAKRQYIQ